MMPPSIQQKLTLSESDSQKEVDKSEIHSIEGEIASGIDAMDSGAGIIVRNSQSPSAPLFSTLEPVVPSEAIDSSRRST
ncbi:hypothetical protein K0M31_016673 [Melipona bicolor]|uniref:Uncharacterized protein n=1 Tax=Melipona bicolor TaxID=60889 RepID=A0AA40FEC5_9HYME|nr:hypothetical protein K0M31_016673 [Melipona bicolor]